MCLVTCARKDGLWQTCSTLRLKELIACRNSYRFRKVNERSARSCGQADTLWSLWVDFAARRSRSWADPGACGDAAQVGQSNSIDTFSPRPKSPSIQQGKAFSRLFRGLLWFDVSIRLPPSTTLMGLLNGNILVSEM